MKDHEGKILYQCPICGKLLMTEHKLKQQIQAIHEDKKPFTCSTICIKRFSQNAHLNLHIKSAHEGKMGKM